MFSVLDVLLPAEILGRSVSWCSQSNPKLCRRLSVCQVLVSERDQEVEQEKLVQPWISAGRRKAAMEKLEARGSVCFSRNDDIQSSFYHLTTTARYVTHFPSL